MAHIRGEPGHLQKIAAALPAWAGRAKSTARAPHALAPSVTVPLAERVTFHPPSLREFYGRVMLGPPTRAQAAARPSTLRLAPVSLLRLEPDDYPRYLSAYLHSGSERFRAAWHDADISTMRVAAETDWRRPAWLPAVCGSATRPTPRRNAPRLIRRQP